MFRLLLHGKALIIVYSYSLSRGSFFATLLQTNGSRFRESQLLSIMMQDLGEIFFGRLRHCEYNVCVYMQKIILADLQR